MSKLLLLSQLLLLLIAATSAKRLLVRPLSAVELDELDQRLPEGRSVRSGLAALTGYTLGLTKALVGVFIYDVITANVTDTESETTNEYAQQVCLNTAETALLARSNVEYNPYDDADVYDNLGRQSELFPVTDTITTGTDALDTTAPTTTTTTPTTASSDGNTNIATCIIFYRNR